MKVKELIEELSKYDDDMTVKICADHQNNMESPFGVSLCASNEKGHRVREWWISGEHPDKETDSSFKFVGIMA